jgi:hypothetical protein
MKPLPIFLKRKVQMTNIQFYKHCKAILLKKEKYSKIIVQKAQQFIDEYITIQKQPSKKI